MSTGLALGSLNRARYAGLDFDTHNDDLRARLQVKYAADFNDFSVSSLGIMLLDLTAYGLDTLSFYVDRRATDTYLATARTRKSVARTSRQLGYAMGGAVASGVDLQVTINEVFTFDVPVPVGFQLDGPDGLIFEVAEDTLFTVAEQGLANSKFIPCYEGETIQEPFVSDGASAQVFQLRRVPDGKFVVQGTVAVTVDGATWDESDLLEYGDTDQFEVGYNDEPSTVRFGDGIAGNIPTAGASIVVTYVASRGKAGQAPAGTIQEETTPLIVAFTEIPLTINNPEAAVGGDDRETLASAKAFAPKVWKSRKVAVTGEDYEALAGSYADPLFGRVAVAKAISSRSAGGDLTVQNYLADIQAAIQTLNAALLSSTTSITASLDDIDAAVTAIAGALVDSASATSTITSEVTSARSSIRTVKDNTAEITVSVDTIRSENTDLANEILSYGPAGTGDLNATQAGSLINKSGRISVEGVNLGVYSAAAESAADAALSDLNAIDDEVTTLGEIGTDVLTQGTEISTESGSIRTQNDSIDTENAVLVTAADVAYDGIDEHLDKVLAADCKSNLVTVPILVRDSGGFYTAPSTGLIDSLQSYLDGKKEVTQSVAVTSGENFLISAVVSARVGVLTGFSEAVVKTAVEAAISGVLRDRAFGDNLYESDLDDVVLEVDGVDFVNTRILGHLDLDGTTVLITHLDSDGNLIVSDSEVISRGSITITTEAVTT